MALWVLILSRADVFYLRVSTFFEDCFRERAVPAAEHLVRHHSTAVGDFFKRLLVGAGTATLSSADSRNAAAGRPCGTLMK